MKLFLILAAFLCLSPLHSDLINNRAGAFVTWWDADDLDDGIGIGAKIDYRLLGILFAEGRTGYVNFEDGNAIPFEGSLNLKMPLPLTPYVGFGYGYYLIEDSGLDSGGGTFIQLGATLELFGAGIFADLRFLDLEENPLDGSSFHVGVSWKF